MFKTVMGLLVGVAVMASPAFAGGGGGGAKKDANIKIVHNLPAPAPEVVYAIVDPPVSVYNKISGATGATTSEFTGAGGVAIKRGKSVTIPVKAGTNKVYACAVSGGKIFLLPIAAPVVRNYVEVTVSKGKTVELKASAFTTTL